jgi:Flp pilus assembly protein TadG
MRYAGFFSSAVRRFRESNSATALIEFAIILPVFTLLAIGVADYGRAYFTAIRVANAATAGAQYGSQDTGYSGNTAGIAQAARNDAGDQTLVVNSSMSCRCASDGPVVSCSDPCGTYSDGFPQSYVQVTASKNVSMLIRYPGLPQTVSVVRTAIFRVQ